MSCRTGFIFVVASMMIATVGVAQTPAASAPAGSTGLCRVMSEAAALAQGNHADHGKACSKERPLIRTRQTPRKRRR